MNTQLVFRALMLPIFSFGVPTFFFGGLLAITLLLCLALHWWWSLAVAGILYLCVRLMYKADRYAPWILLDLLTLPITNRLNIKHEK